MDTAEKQMLTEAVKAFPERKEKRPNTFGPAPHRQANQFPEEDHWEEELFDYVKNFDGIEVNASHVSGDGGLRAFFNPSFEHLSGPQEKFLVDNEFAHIHAYKSHCMHAVLPPEIGELIFSKKWGEMHPLSKRGFLKNTNYLLYGARNREETCQLKILLRISYLFAFNKW